ASLYLHSFPTRRSSDLVDGEMRLVALGRRLDDGESQTFAAQQDWRELLPQGEWVHLAATFDYTTGEMALYRNGEPVPGFYVLDRSEEHTSELQSRENLV